MTNGGLARLTPRHRQCLRLFAQFRSAKEIAADLDISVNTVNSYLAEARKLLGASSTRLAARMLLEAESTAPENMGGAFTRVVEPPGEPAILAAPDRHDSPPSRVRDSGTLRWESASRPRPRFSLPGFRVEGPGVELGWMARLRFMVRGALAIMAIVLLAVAGAEALVRIGHGLLG